MTARTGAQRPNVIFILSDDHAAWAMGCAGNGDIHTPNLDRLASSGIRFTNFFCASPVCSPARASLLTGRIPSAHGVHDWIREGNVGPDAIEYLDGIRGYTEDLDDAGYFCSLSGKWHLGDSAHPQKGFRHWYAHQGGASSYHNAPVVRDGILAEEPRYFTEAVTDDALTMLDQLATGSSPFYLAVHYTAPHSPWVNQHPLDIVAGYERCAFTSCPSEPVHPWALPSTVPASVWSEPQEHLKGYFAAVTAMDGQIGRILDAVEAKGLRANTLICYLSDNGFNCGHHGIWGKGNGTFPQNMYDTSIRVPAIMSQPGVIPEGHVCDELVSGYDWYPTLLDYLDVPQPRDAALPGHSFSGLLDGHREAHRSSVVVFDEYGPTRMIRTKEWKYVHRYPYGPHELYDLVHDPDERSNLLDSSPQPDTLHRAEDMKAQLDSWFVQFVDPRLDGVREPVTGRGQLRRAGPAGAGVEAFAQDKWP